MSVINGDIQNNFNPTSKIGNKSSAMSGSLSKQSESTDKKATSSSVGTDDKVSISDEAKETGGKGEKGADTTGIVNGIKDMNNTVASDAMVYNGGTDEVIKNKIKGDSQAGKIYDKMNESQKKEFIDIARKSYKPGRDDLTGTNKPDYLQVLAGSKITQKDKLEQSTNEVTDTLKKGKSVPVSIGLNKGGKGSEASNKMLIENIERDEVTLKAPDTSEKRQPDGKKIMGDRSEGGRVIKMNREDFHRRLAGYHAQRESSLKKLRENWIK